MPSMVIVPWDLPGQTYIDPCQKLTNYCVKGEVKEDQIEPTKNTLKVAWSLKPISQIVYHPQGVVERSACCWVIISWYSKKATPT